MACPVECWLVPAIIGQVVGVLFGLVCERLRMRKKLAFMSHEINKLNALLTLGDNDSQPPDSCTLGSRALGGPPVLVLPAATDHARRSGSLSVTLGSPPPAVVTHGTKEFRGRSKKQAGSEAFFNEIFKHMWPHISKYVETVLRESVQPALQASMPDMLSGIHFSEQKCHLGSQPMYFEHVVCLGVERFQTGGAHRDSNHGSSTTEGSLRLVAEVALIGNCEIELEVPLLGNLGNAPILGRFTETRVGVSDLRLTGTLVVELCSLRDDLPLIGGIRVYFVNPPDLDLKLTGALGCLQNVGIIRKYLVDAILKQLCATLVLPKRIATPLAGDMDIFQLSTPMPEGMLRLQVRSAAGADKTDRDAGGAFESFSTIMSMAQSLVGNPTSKIPMYIKVVFGDGHYRTPTVDPNDKNALQWEFNNTFDFTVHDPVAQKFMVFLYTEENHWMCGRTQGDCLAYGEVNAQEIIESEPKVLKIHMTKFSTPEQELQETPSMPLGKEVRDLELTICKEWRPFTVREVTGAMWSGSRESRDESTWNLVGRTHTKEGAEVDANDDINCKLLVGFYGARDLPSDKHTYWCKVSCTNATNFSGGGNREVRKEKETSRVRANCCSTWRYPPPGVDDGLSERCGSSRNLGAHECSSNMVEVIWEQPKFFHLHSLLDVELTVELFCSANKEPLGSLIFNPSCLNALNRFSETVDAPLTDHMLGLTKVPSVRIVFQLWLLQSQDLWTEGSKSCHLVADLGSHITMLASP